MTLISSDQIEKAAPVTKIAPAPWTLSGDGHIIICYSSREQNLSDAAIPIKLRESFQNLLSIMMFVNYKSSPVGPYRELLYIPGRFRFPFGKSQYHASITKIYVDSHDSTWNGRQNWGIPKEMAEFQLTCDDDGTEHIKVMQNQTPFASFSVHGKGPKLPVNLKFLPAWSRTFGEILNNKYFQYTFNGRGKLQWATFQAEQFNQKLFPDMTQRRCILALKVTDFTLHFPVSKTLTLDTPQ